MVHAGAGLCSAAGCMWSCRAEELSVHFALWLREGYKFVNVACKRNCITGMVQYVGSAMLYEVVGWNVELYCNLYKCLMMPFQ